MWAIRLLLLLFFGFAITANGDSYPEVINFTHFSLKPLMIRENNISDKNTAAKEAWFLAKNGLILNDFLRVKASVFPIQFLIKLDL